MDKIINVFIDESGDSGFIKDASKYYIITFVFHHEKHDITSNIEKISSKPVFHAGPIIRKEYPFNYNTPEERKRLLHSIFLFILPLPIKVKTFVYLKKEFNKDIFKMQARISKDFYNFFIKNYNYFLDKKLIVYYDNGQNLITKLLNINLTLCNIDFEFKREVHARDYRLYQVADFVSTIKLLEIKMNNNEMSKSEKMLFNNRYLKKNYIKALNKKEL